MTNHEIDLEIKRLQRLKKFDRQTSDGKDFVVGSTYYYCGSQNNVKEIVINENWEIGKDYLYNDEGDSFGYNNVYADKGKCLEDNIRFKTF